MADKIQLRRGLANSWTTTNPLLAAGEPGVESDTSRLKIGDGVTYWNSLPYAVLDENTYVSTQDLVISPIAPASPTVGLVWIQTT